MENSGKIKLRDNELKLLRDVMRSKGVAIDELVSDYTMDELRGFGFFRENWSTEELIEKGYTDDEVITSFDEISSLAVSDLAVDVPFAEGVKKWQLPISLPGLKAITTVFPPGTKVELHEHPNFDGASRCGQLRVVTRGSILYNGVKYRPGDWFYIPNGVPYSFVTDPDEETSESYFYQYNVHGGDARFSSPEAI